MAIGIAISLLYWIIALFFLLFSQIGDPAPELQTPEGMRLVYASRRTGLIILVAEVLIYATLFLWIRRASKPGSE